MGRTNAFDFLRLFAALTVVIGHTVSFFDISFFNFSLNGGYFFLQGVPLFFILSGFLIYKSYERCVENNNPTQYFYRNRWLRIAPAIYTYALITTVVFLISGVLSISSLKELPVIAWFVSNIALIPVYHPSIFQDFGVGVVNGSLWTIPAEFSFYMVVPLLFLFEKRVGFPKMIVSLLTLSVLSGFSLLLLESLPTESLITKFYKVSFAPYFLYFCLGIYWSKMWSRTPKKLSLFILSAAVFLLSDSYLIHQTENLVFQYLINILWAVPLSYMAIYFGYSAPKFFGKLTNKIGDLSFGVYIWHMIVINYFIEYSVDNRLQLPDLAFHGIIIVISCILAWCSWTLIEKPALRLKPYSSRNQEFKKEIIKSEIA